MSVHLSTDACTYVWFSGWTSLITGDRVHSQWVRKNGDVIVIEQDLVNGGAPIETVLGTHSPADDHDTCGIVERKNDGRLIAFFAPHAAGNGVSFRISTTAGRSNAWGATFAVNEGAGPAYTYGWPFYLGNRLCLITRAKSGNDYFMQFFYSDSHGDDGSWVGPLNLSRSQTATNWNYLVADTDGVNRVDLAWSIVDVVNTGPTGAQQRLDVYHAYLEYNGANLEMRQSDGALICSESGTPKNFPAIVETDTTQVYDSSAGGNEEAWVWCVRTNGTTPAVAWAGWVNPELEHHYYWSKWSGSAWPTEETMVNIGTANGPMTVGPGGAPQSATYSGGMIFGANDEELYLSIGRYDIGFGIHRYTRTGPGTWTRQETVAGSDGDKIRCRPFVPAKNQSWTVDQRCRLFWMDGFYNFWQDWDSSASCARGIGDNMAAAGWSWYCPMTSVGTNVVSGPHGDVTFLLTDLASLPSNFWSQVKDGGGDIRISLGVSNPQAGEYYPLTPLPVEVARCDKTGQKLELYIDFSVVEASGTDTTFVLWYGNAAASQSSGLLGVDAQGFPPDCATWHPKVFFQVYHFNEAAGGPYNSSCAGSIPLVEVGTVTKTTDPWGHDGALSMLDNQGALDLSPQQSVGTAAACEIWYNAINTQGIGQSWPWCVGFSGASTPYNNIREVGSGATREVAINNTSLSNEPRDLTAPAGWKFVTGRANFSPHIQVNDRTRESSTQSSGGTFNTARCGGVSRPVPQITMDGEVAELRVAYQGNRGYAKRGEAYHSTLYRNSLAANQATWYTAGTPVDIGGTPPDIRTMFVDISNARMTAGGGATFTITDAEGQGNIQR